MKTSVMYPGSFSSRFPLNSCEMPWSLSDGYRLCQRRSIILTDSRYFENKRQEKKKKGTGCGSKECVFLLLLWLWTISPHQRQLFKRGSTIWLKLLEWGHKIMLHEWSCYSQRTVVWIEIAADLSLVQRGKKREISWVSHNLAAEGLILM